MPEPREDGLPAFTYPFELLRCVDRALLRLDENVRALSPPLFDAMREWTCRIAGGSRERYLTHPEAFPLLLLPWWVEESLRGRVDTELQQDLVYSSVAGYYFIRLIDNAMDEDRAAEIELLPMLAFWHAEFHGVYTRWFSPDQPFWAFFRRQWILSAEASMVDARLAQITEQDFRAVSSKKVSAGKIPMAAVCMLHGADLPDAWERAFDLLGYFHQMNNDLWGWQRDLDAGIRTFFLSEAERRRARDEAVIAWVMREGVAWGCTVLRDCLTELGHLADSLASEGFVTYVQARQARLDRCMADIAPGLESVTRLLGQRA